MHLLGYIICTVGQQQKNVNIFMGGIYKTKSVEKSNSSTIKGQNLQSEYIMLIRAYLV